MACRPIDITVSVVRQRSALVLLILLAGCAPDTGGRLPVTGTISLKGQPIDQGTINFSAKPGTEGGFAGALIQDGKYSIPASQGLMPGIYQVRISAPVPGTAVAETAPGESGPPAQDRVPPRYNSQTTLEFEVKAGLKNEFSFDVP